MSAWLIQLVFPLMAVAALTVVVAAAAWRGARRSGWRDLHKAYPHEGVDEDCAAGDGVLRLWTGAAFEIHWWLDSAFLHVACAEQKGRSFGLTRSTEWFHRPFSIPIESVRSFETPADSNRLVRIHVAKGVMSLSSSEFRRRLEPLDEP